ncbi:MAG: DUF6265 family protein [Planctomycetota bacterium]
MNKRTVVRTLCLATVCLALTPTRTFAQEAEKPPEATLKDMTWIAGHWRGKGLGGDVEEVWAPPLGDSMTGMFKLVQNNKTQFYELLSIVPLNESLVLRVKHFDPKFHGWEEKDEVEEFPLSALKPGRAVFSGLTFEQKTKNELIITVASEDDGKKQNLVFRFQRVAN